MSIKIAQNDFTRKIKDFDTFTKIALECGRFGQTNCCHILSKVAQSARNNPIWSHCYPLHLPTYLSGYVISSKLKHCWHLAASSGLRIQYPLLLIFDRKRFRVANKGIKQKNVKM